MGITMAHIGHVRCIGCAQREREAGGWLRCTWMLHVACADAECAVAVLWMHVLVHGMWWVGVGGGLVLAGCICALGWGITCVDHHGWQWMHTGKC